MSRRVVVTGLGAITALGEGAEMLWQAARDGQSGIRLVDLGGPDSCKIPAAAVEGFDPEKFVTQRKSLKVMARDIQLAVAGASLAMKDSKIDDGQRQPERSGVIVGSGVLNHELDELAYSIQNSLDNQGDLDLKKFGESGLPSLFPLWLLKYLPNMPACHISILFNLQGMNNTITTGASAGMQAAGEAFRIIQRGAADLMLAGGAESKVNPVGVSQYKVLGALTESHEKEPGRCYRPFDESAKGFVIGEGAAFLVLEELEHARKRGAQIYAEIIGFGSSSRTGQKEAMQAALEDAGLKPSDLSYLQASGIGLKEEDRREAGAIGQVFNGTGKNLFVSASKAVTGFSGFSAGAMDLVISTKALSLQTIPPAHQFEKAEKDWGFRIVKEKSVRQPFAHSMTNAFGFGGQAASMVMRRYEG